MPDTSVHLLSNLGPKSAAWLAEIGVLTRGDLERVGIADAYRLLKQAGYPASLNLLWAMYGAVHGIDWRDVPEAEKQRLRKAIGR